MANKSINEKPCRRAYTLQQVQTEVGRRFDAGEPTVPGGWRLSPPAMPTLKLWSKEGVFNKALILSKAADIAAARVTAQPQRFSAVNSRPLGKKQHAASALSQQAGVAVAQTGSDEARAELHAVRNDLAALHERFNELQRISDMAYSSIQKLILLVQAQAGAALPQSRAAGYDAHQLDGAGAAVPADMVRAINQLDAVRKHVLVSMDRETQMLRQQGSAVQHRQQEGMSALDAQRIIARLSNVEQQNFLIVQLMQSKVEQ